MATQKVLQLPEAAASFKDSGGTAVMTLQNLANAVGRVSAQWDRGTGAKPATYRARCVFPLQATHTAVLGEAIEVYIASSDGTDVDGDVGTADAALTTDKCRNLALLGVVQVDVVAADAELTKTFTVEIFDRYVSLGVMNKTSDHLQDDANECYITLTPYTPEIQAAS